jgi:hypothetical protein
MSEDTVASVAESKTAVARKAYEVTAEYRSPVLLDSKGTGANDCWAVGTSGDLASGGQTLISHYSGSNWTIFGRQ